jgi:hypothetical protein
VGRVLIINIYIVLGFLPTIDSCGVIGCRSEILSAVNRAVRAGEIQPEAETTEDL